MKFVAIDPRDTSRHTPDASDNAYWQESFFIGWHDVRNCCGGHHHISLYPYRGLAHVWSWLALDGRVIARVQEHALPLPSDDLRDLRLGPFHFKAGASVRDLRFEAGFDNAQLSLDYRSLYDPVEISLDAAGMTIGARHYESMGRVRGSLEASGRQIAIDGVAWQDHSWGTRKFSSNPAGRWLFAVFGDDFAVSAFCLATPTAAKEFGYVWDGGAIRPVDRAAFRMIVNDTEVTPAGCDATVGTEDARAWRIQGEVHTVAISGGTGWSDGGEWWGYDGLARFECGGRVGAGFLEVFEFGPSRARRDELRLP